MVFLGSISCKYFRSISCFQIKKNAAVTDNLYGLPYVYDFNNVANNSASPNECSPILKDNYFSPFKGLLINTPKEVVWPKNYNSSDAKVMPGDALKAR